MENTLRRPLTVHPPSESVVSRLVVSHAESELDAPAEVGNLVVVA